MSTAPSDLSVKSSALNVESSASPAAVDAVHPWLGLASFTEETRAFFHGRDEEVAELSRRVQRKLLTVLFGQSGLGKTSILRAGIVPRLKPEGYCPVYVRLDYGRESPPPSEQIKQAIFRATQAAGDWTQPGVSQQGETLWEFLHHRDDVLRDQSGRTLIPLLIFDQFEEIFTLAQGDDFGRQRAAQFIEDLADLVENRAPKALEARLERDEASMERFDFARADYRLLLALREDYLAQLEGLKSQMPSVTQNRMRLARMTGAQAFAAVTGPGRALVSDEVARAIVRFIAGGAELERAEVEPSLLSLVCRELNNTRLAQGRREISADLLAGSRDTILSEFYERALADQPAGVRAFVEDEFLTDSGYRESIAEERVKKGFAAAGAPPEALATLVDRRLLRVEERLDVRRVELTHDVLCGVVKTSRDVRQERESKANMERQLAETRAKEAATRVALFRARLVAGICSVLLLAAVASSVYGFTSQRRARAAEREAVAAAELARSSAAEAVKARRLTETARTQAEDMLGYVLTDLEEQLTDFGQLPIQLGVSRMAVGYYAGLPPELMSQHTRMAQARALANLGAILDVQGESKSSRLNLERALGIFETVERGGELTPATRMDFAAVLVRLARLATSETHFTEAVPLCDRAEKLLAPALADTTLRGRALRVLAAVLERKGFSLLRSGRPREAASVYQRALASAEEADRLPPDARRPGLQAATIMPWLGEALDRSNRPDEGQQMNEIGRSRLQQFVEAEPFLVSARRHLAYATSATGFYASRQWDFERARTAREEFRDLYRQMLKLDPRNTTYLNNLAISYAGEAFFERARGNFAGAERAIQQGLAMLSVDWATNFMRANLANGHVALAGICADAGRDAEAEAQLGQMQTLVQPLMNEASADTNARALTEELWLGRRRNVEVARLNWARVRTGAEQSLARLEKLPSAVGDEQFTGLREDASRQLVLAAWASGDYPAARRALAVWWAARDPLPDNPRISLNRRFVEVQAELLRIHVLARAGEGEEARRILGEIWSEVEALFAAAPEERFNQVQLANALWIKAEVAAGLDGGARRALLERAAGYLRPLAASGKLTRFEREVYLAGIEKNLAGVARP